MLFHEKMLNVGIDVKRSEVCGLNWVVKEHQLKQFVQQNIKQNF